MTKYILHGGRANLPSQGNKDFYKEIVSGLEEPVNLLSVYFARQKEEWPMLFEKDKENFSKINIGKEVKLTMSNPDLNVFREQLKTADAVYVLGGNTYQLVEQIRNVPDFLDLIQNKVYAGSSAGMYLICKYFYENDFDTIGEGLGALQVKGFAHWKDQMNALEKLQATGENLPIYKLAEGEFIIREQ